VENHSYLDKYGRFDAFQAYLERHCLKVAYRHPEFPLVAVNAQLAPADKVELFCK
jgi:hypothetical protein